MSRVTRLLTGAASLVALTAFAGEAAAQYYPRPYPEPYYARPARPLPPPIIEDEELPPGVYGAPSQQPYRRDPPVARYPLEAPSAPDRGYQDRNTYSDRGYDGRGVPPPPYDARPPYDGRPAYDGRPPYSEPYDRAPTTGALPGPAPLGRRDDGLPRPPGDVGTLPPAPGAQPADRNTTIASLPPDYQPEQGTPKALPEHLRRQEVAYPTNQPAGTIIIDTPNTYLYLVLGNGRAMRYGVGVGREGFTWSGSERISKMTEWPDWFPPKEMIERQPYLPRFMAGGTQNPLGARALYLGKTLYRIHGTNQPSTIGTFVSSGCVRLVNDDIEDLFRRVQVGTRVVVVASGNAQMLSALPASSAGPAAKPKPKQVGKPAKPPQAKVSTGLPAPAAKTASEPSKAQQSKESKAESKTQEVKAQELPKAQEPSKEPPKASPDQSAAPAPAPAATQQ